MIPNKCPIFAGPLTRAEFQEWKDTHWPNALNVLPAEDRDIVFSPPEREKVNSSVLCRFVGGMYCISKF